jgi:hypothetical protein
MAYSKIIIDFLQVPEEDQVLNFSETLLGLSLNSIFKNISTVMGEVLIPESSDLYYEMTIDGSADISNIDVEFTPPGGITTRVSLSSVLVEDNLDGTYTYKITSSSPVLIVDVTTGDYILWIEGNFSSSPGYNGYISTNYKIAFDEDYNASADFTVDALEGTEGSGQGTVTITANFSNAFFSLVTNTSLAEITIINEVPLEPENSVTPLVLDFEVVMAIATATSQNITINTTEDWDILDVLPAWIELSAISGTGNTVVSVTPVNYASLDAGNYNATFDVVIGIETFSVTVNLTVFNFVQNPFSPGKLYFSQELDYLKFDSETPGTFIDFNIEIKVFKINTYEPIIYNRPYKFPLFQGKGDFHIGSIVHGLFEEIQELSDFVPSLKTNYYKAQYRPAEISVSFEEKTYGVTVPGLVNSSIPMFKMAKGFKPFTTENQLALLTVAQQEVTRITPQSFVGTSFVYFGTPRIIVKKNNAIIDDFEIEEADSEKVIFSYFRFLDNLKPGDSLELIVVNGLETRSQRFLVFKNGLESTYFFFENNNGVLEPFELSGRRRISSPIKHITTTKFKKLHSFNSKVKAEISQNMVVNTGQLTKNDHRVLTALVASDKVWCSLDTPEGPYFRVDATTNRVDNQDTSVSEEDFNIEFNILENANASIYPR